MTDACGCGDDEPRNDDGELEEHEPERLWEVSELRFAAARRGLPARRASSPACNDASERGGDRAERRRPGARRLDLRARAP